MTDRKCLVGGCERPRHAHGYCSMHYRRWKKYGKPTLRPSAAERFWAAVERGGDGDCWRWLNRTASKNGYGRLSVNGRETLAHRFAYELLVGPIPDGLQIDHLCRNRACVNPAHLEAVTRKENILRGESDPAKRARQTHCKRGHPLVEGNLYIDAKRGHRKCRRCTLDAQASPEQKRRRNARLRERARELGHWPH